jgi:queuine tRNA-ribosyltransferase
MPENFTHVHTSKDSRARAGILHTDHGDVETPVFMPVGTQATVKSLDAADMEALGAKIILNNTYHLHLRPGEDTVKALGGVHAFQKWDRAILTDSGGYQVFSLGAKKAGTGSLVKIDEDGVTFTSHFDGSKHRFTPEEAIRIQQKLGPDVIMAFDQCTSDAASLDEARAAMGRTHRWADRCLEAFKDKKDAPAFKQQLFGIVQGGVHEALRKESAAFIASRPFDGFAIGGESVGYDMGKTREILGWIRDLMPEDKARYTMGVGLSPEDLFDVVEAGVDMFDCVSPTRVARNGALFNRAAGRSRKYRIEIGNAAFERDERPVDKECGCTTCARHSRAYLRHLFKTEELAYFRLATIHNLHFLLDLMRRMRQAVLEDRFLEFKKGWIAG